MSERIVIVGVGTLSSTVGVSVFDPHNATTVHPSMNDTRVGRVSPWELYKEKQMAVPPWSSRYRPSCKSGDYFPPSTRSLSFHSPPPGCVLAFSRSS